MNTTVFVANTYVSEDRHCSLLVCDEVHNYSNADAPVFSKIVLNTRYSFFLGLSATLDQERLDFLSGVGIPLIDRVTLAEARREKWVSDFKVLCLGVDLNTQDRIAYQKMHEEFNKYFAIFNHDFKLAMSCMTAEGSRRHAETLSEAWDEKRIRIAAIQWNRNMRNRKKFLYHADCKVSLASEAIKKLKLHTIAFCQTTAGADTLETYVGDGCKAYHSKKGIRYKRIALQEFESQEIYCLSTAEALDEGFDVEHIELGVVWARTSVPLQSIQRIGRTIRFVEGKVAFIIQIYVKGTQDENWLRKSLKGTPSVLWLNDIEQVYQIIDV
jgi:superfamily II DNA or RNA helicase